MNLDAMNAEVSGLPGMVGTYNAAVVAQRLRDDAVAAERQRILDLVRGLVAKRREDVFTPYEVICAFDDLADDIEAGR